MSCFRYTSYILKHVTKVLGITWELRGREQLAAERGCVIVANHQSMLDILGERLLVGRRPLSLIREMQLWV
jgi:1-acyl-sn-glycerol-3-phosphate acyltransferase